MNSIDITPSQITISLNRAELFEKICNISALNAKYVSEEINVDSLIITADEKYFFDTNIGPIVASLANYFVRIITEKNDTYTISDSEIKLVFNASSLTDGRLTKVEVDILCSLVEEYIVTEILRLWYHSVAPNELLATKYVGEATKIDRRLRIILFQFYKPTSESSIIDSIKISGMEDVDILHINNRSDFVLVWKGKNFAVLPDTFSVSFYTTGNEIYEVSYPSVGASPKVIPIKDEQDRMVAAHIVFDLSTEAKYFQDGRLRYTMVADISNPMFADGIQTVESSDTLPIEIWGGPSDQMAKVEATFIPAYAKLVLADLTPEEIAILQGPANSAASNANLAANRATNAAQEAETATQTLIAKADYAELMGDRAQFAAIAANAKIDEINSTNQSIKEAENKREEAEEERGRSWSNLSSAVNSAISSTYQSVSEANKATSEASSAAEIATSAKQQLDGFFNEVSSLETVRQEWETKRIADESERISHENERVSAENMRIEAENARKEAESKREDNEAVRGTQETQRQTNETNRVEAENARVVAETKRQEDTSTAISNATEATNSANQAAASANEVVATLEEFKTSTTERVDELELKIDRVFDGGRADITYGPSVRVIDCKGA